MKKNTIKLLLLFVLIFIACAESTTAVDPQEETTKNNLPVISGYPIVSTAQSKSYNNSNEISLPSTGELFFGQDANYSKNEPKYQDNGDGTVTDLVTGLMWSQSLDMDGDGDIDANDKMTYSEALSGESDFDLAGYDDWRLPTIKEQYSLILFSGVDPSGYEGTATDGLVPFIDTEYFDFAYGDTDARERIIDSQYASTSCMLMGNCCSELILLTDALKDMVYKCRLGQEKRRFM